MGKKEKAQKFRCSRKCVTTAVVTIGAVGELFRTAGPKEAGGAIGATREMETARKVAEYRSGG